MSVCIHYSRPASGSHDGEVFGLDVAVTNFLSAYFRHGTPEKFICRPTDMPSFEHFKTLATQVGHDAETKCIGLDPRHPRHNLVLISCLFRPDPLIADFAWRRQQVVGRGYVACGLVHTMSGERIARAVGDLCLAPTDASDALICPSEAIRDAVRNLWEINADYLNHRLGGKFICPVQTPVIPLGIDTQKFAKLATADKRAAQRQALGVGDDEVVLLFHGRLSFATKAHPLPLLLAAERAAEQTQRKLRLVMYGYFKPKEMEPHFHNLVAAMCKKVRVDFIMNDDPRFPDALWAGADIFMSLADNIQESFGLTPIEAMAAGLPAIVTDWDGYRGGVRDRVDGFLIPTIAPPPEAGMAIAEAYYNQENYGVSLMGAAQSTALDIARCAEAIATLANDDAKRRAFGANGQERARAVYDWQHIIKQYENLWRDLAAQRQATPPRPAVPPHWQAAHPSYPNPWRMFESFPSRLLTPEDVVRVVMSDDEAALLFRHEMNFFLPELLAPEATLRDLIKAIRAAGTPRARDILAAFPATEQDCLWRCIGWMLKHGVAEVGG